MVVLIDYKESIQSAILNISKCQFGALEMASSLLPMHGNPHLIAFQARISMKYRCLTSFRTCRGTLIL